MVKYTLIIGYQKEIIFRRLQHCVSHYNPNGEQYQKLKKEMWLKSLGLDENKIIGDRKK